MTGSATSYKECHKMCASVWLKVIELAKENKHISYEELYQTYLRECNSVALSSPNREKCVHEEFIDLEKHKKLKGGYLRKKVFRMLERMNIQSEVDEFVGEKISEIKLLPKNLIYFPKRC